MTFYSTEKQFVMNELRPEEREVFQWIIANQCEDMPIEYVAQQNRMSTSDVHCIIDRLVGVHGLLDVS